MAGDQSSCFLFLFLLSLPISFSNGALVDLSENAKGVSETITMNKPWTKLTLNKVPLRPVHVFGAENVVDDCLQKSGLSVDLFLNEDQTRTLINNNPSAISKLKAEILASSPNGGIESIILGHENGNLGHGEVHKLLSTLKKVQYVLSSFCHENNIKLSVAFSLPQLEKLNKQHARFLPRMFNFLDKARLSLVIVEKGLKMESSMPDQLVRPAIERAIAVPSFSPWQDFQMVWRIKGLDIHTAAEKGRFLNEVYKHLGANPEINGEVADLYVEALFSGKNRKTNKKEQAFPHRELLSNLRTTDDDDSQTPPATDPLTPISTTPKPNVITVPANIPVSVTPTPIPIPSTTTTLVPPPINPVNTPVPTTNPATTPITVPGAQPVTNPVTTYPSPQGDAPPTPVTSPVNTPVTNPVAPPTSVTNAPAIPGQSWCIARSGVPETALQQALDYACGIGGADCSQIQQGANCYNPNSLQNHASYAFNSYYQKNPVPTSCDFGGTAVIVNANPSTGSCVFPSSSSSSTPATSTPTTTPTTPTPPTMPTTPVTPTPPIPPTPPVTPTPNTASSSSSSSSAPPVSGSGTPPVLNASNPATTIPTGYGTTIPPATTTSESISTNFPPHIGCIVLLTTLVAAKLMIT